jgi:hypothetical protein
VARPHYAGDVFVAGVFLKEENIELLRSRASALRIG